MEVHDPIKGQWRLTGYYGFPERARRRNSWNLIRSLASSSNYPWVLIGDFNDLLNIRDKMGGSDHPNWCINGFREVITECNLHDLPLYGYPFTWARARGTPHAVEERLNLALVTNSWLAMFDNARLIN